MFFRIIRIGSRVANLLVCFGDQRIEQVYTQYINRLGGNADSWERIDCPIDAVYSRSICPIDGKRFLVLGAGSPSGRYNSVSYAVMSLS